MTVESDPRQEQSRWTGPRWTDADAPASRFRAVRLRDVPTAEAVTPVPVAAIAAAGLVAAAAIAWVLAGGPAGASTPADGGLANGAQGGLSCGDLALSRAEVRRLEGRGQAAVMQDLEGAAAERWIAAFNAYPPQTEYDADALLAAVTGEGGGVVLALFRGGCRVGVGELPAQVYIDIVDRVESAMPGA